LFRLFLYPKIHDIAPHIHTNPAMTVVLPLPFAVLKLSRRAVRS